MLGTSEASIPTGLGGTLLVVPGVLVALVLPSAGLTLDAAVPDDPALCDQAFDLQVLEQDPGASHGVSFTPGLALLLGR